MKLAGHVEDRIKERSPGAEADIERLRALLRSKPLEEKTTYHVPLSNQRGFAVVGDVGKKKRLHVVKTVLSNQMRPPGRPITFRQLEDTQVKVAALLWKLAAAEEHKDKMHGGLADKKKPEDFDSAQLAKGIRVEMEHTNDRQVAREIAMDHLTEDARYYDKLEKIEKSAAYRALFPRRGGR